MTQTFKEKLTAILLEKFTHARPSLKKCEYSLKYQEAEEAIVEAIESIIPKQLDRPNDSHIFEYPDGLSDGNNACRKEIIERLNG